jgi:hypothetical protein
LECDQAPDREAPWQPAVEVTPAAQIDARYKQQRNDDPGLKRPRLKYAGYNRIGEVFFYFKLWSVAHRAFFLAGSGCAPASVIPAKAGIQLFNLLNPPGLSWMPASAGMTLFSLHRKALGFNRP